MDDEEGSEWVKELLVQGRGRSRWGRFSYRGRVRAWDGLLTMEKRYEVRRITAALPLSLFLGDTDSSLGFRRTSEPRTSQSRRPSLPSGSTEATCSLTRA